MFSLKTSISLCTTKQTKHEHRKHFFSYRKHLLSVGKLAYQLSPQKRKAVISARDTNAKRRKVEGERVKRPDSLSEDGISRILPGKEDKVSMKVESGKEARQKRLLLVNLREAHALFKEGSKLKVVFTEFESLRPPQVLPMTLRDHEVCMCKYHENIDLLLHTLTTTSLVSSHYKTAEDLLNAKVCSQEESTCMDRECSNCGVDRVVNELFNTDDELPVSYYQWRTPADGRVKKLLVVSNVVGTKEDLKAQLSPVGRHVYNVRR